MHPIRQNPKITIVTCTYNSSRYLAENISSVKSQTYGNYEHIFIDGGSADNTIEIIKQGYPAPIYVSEKDSGIYDAINKGIKMSSGDVVGLLHSDDVFFDSGCLERIARAFMEVDGLDFYCSTLWIYDLALENRFAVLGSAPHARTLKEQLYSSTNFAHPTYYCRRSVFDKIGFYSTDYKIAGDIDWLIRLEKAGLSFHFDSKPLIKFRSSGESAKKYILALKEEFDVRVKYDGLNVGLVFIYFFHLIRRCSRYFLEVVKMGFMIVFFRKIIYKLFKNR